MAKQSTYVRKIGEGRFECGVVQRAANFRKQADKFIPMGTFASVSEAEAARAEIDAKSAA